MPWHDTDPLIDSLDKTDSTSTDTYDIGTILSHFHWWILRLSAIQKKSPTEQYNNIKMLPGVIFVQIISIQPSSPFPNQNPH